MLLISFKDSYNLGVPLINNFIPITESDKRNPHTIKQYLLQLSA